MMTLREKWYFLTDLQKLHPNNKHATSYLKEEIRQYYKNHPIRNPLDRIHYDKDGSSYWTLTKFPAECYERRMEIMENLRFERPCSLYDCTGAKFTMLMDLYTLKDGSFFIYHLVGFDI